MDIKRSTMAKPKTNQVSTRTLVLAGTSLFSPATAPYTVMRWAEAQIDGFEQFPRFRRFLCLPTSFPTTKIDPLRDRMCDQLRLIIEQGADAVLLVPAPVMAEDGSVDRDWLQTRYVVERIANVRLDPRRSGATGGPVIASCPEAALRHLRQVVPKYALEPRSEGTRRFSTDPSAAIGAYNDLSIDPYAIVGRAGKGRWAVLPAPSGSASAGVVEGLLPLLLELRKFDRCVASTPTVGVSEFKPSEAQLAVWIDIAEQIGVDSRDDMAGRLRKGKKTIQDCLQVLETRGVFRDNPDGSRDILRLPPGDDGGGH